MAALDTRSGKTRADELNPSSNGYEDTFNNSLSQDDVARGIKDAENFANKNDQTQAGQAADSIDSQERNAQSPNSSTPIKNNFTGEKFILKGTLVPKKKGALTTIIVFLLAIVGIGGTLFTPGLGIIHMKEVLTGDLNDQLAAMDIRGNAVFKAKLSNMSKGICTGVKIKCKFTSMSQRQIDKFKVAGFVIADDGVKEGLFGRKIITTMTAPDGSVIKNPADLTKARNSSMEVRRAMNRVFSPVYYGLSDKVANTFFKNNNTNKKKKITGATEDEKKKSLATAVAGEKANGGGVLKDSKGNYIIDEDGARVYESDSPDRFNELKSVADEKATALNSREKVGGKAVGGVITGAAKGVSILGAADSACTVYNTARAVGAAAKIARSMQLVQYAMVVNSTADSILAGDAQPDETEFVGKLLTATDARQTILNEETGQVEANPFYGSSAFDSPGFKTAQYNEAPTLTLQSQQYMVGGGLSGTLSVVLSDITNSIGGPDNVRSTCQFVQSPWVRGAGLVIGVFAAVGSFGVSTAISVGASIVAGLALPFLESALADIVAGTVVNGDTAGVDAGDAMFAGTASILGGIAMMRGMAPMSKSGFKSYLAATTESTSDMIALQKYEAAKTPFDVSNQYSFLGSFARSLYPTSITAKTSISGALTSVGSIVSQGFASIIKPVSASSPYNEARFSKCNDPGYTELGIDADIFCNVRYGLTAEELSLDTESVVDFMINNGFINDDGAPQKEYADFLKNCVNRTDGWGDTSEEGGNIGLECIDGQDLVYDNISYFRVYTMDSSISDAMDEEQLQGSAPTGDYVLPVEEGYKKFDEGQDWGVRNICASSNPNSFCKFHRGVDFSNYSGGSAGKSVFSVADGEVIEASLRNSTCYQTDSGDAGADNRVRIKHADGTITGYSHMPVSAITVKVGDKVTAGQKIGEIGNCGNSMGAHLHFTVSPGDTTNQQILALDRNVNGEVYLDPIGYMNIHGVDLVGKGR